MRKQLLQTTSLSSLELRDGLHLSQNHATHLLRSMKRQAYHNVYLARLLQHTIRSCAFFCQKHDDKQAVHAIQSESRGKQLHEFVKNCDRDLYKVYLSSAITPDDALSIDVQYHRICWTKHVLLAADHIPQPEHTVHQENEIAANIEFLNLMRNLLEEGKILCLDDAYKTYLDILKYHLCEASPRKYLRELMMTNIDGIEFAHAFRRNESDRFYLTAAKIAAIDSAVENCSDSDLNTIFHCSKIIRQEILKAKNWQFDGKLDADKKKLLTLLQWIISGVATELHTEKRVDDVNKKATLLSQKIMFEVKIDRQVKHAPKSDETEKPF